MDENAPYLSLELYGMKTVCNILFRYNIELKEL